MKTINISTSRAIAVGTLGVMTLGSTALLSQPAQASSSTWKKVAIGAAAVTGYGLLKHNGKATTLGAVATAGSYYMYKKDKKKEEEQNRWRYRRYNRYNLR